MVAWVAVQHLFSECGPPGLAVSMAPGNLLETASSWALPQPYGTRNSEGGAQKSGLISPPGDYDGLSSLRTPV